MGFIHPLTSLGGTILYFSRFMVLGFHPQHVNLQWEFVDHLIPPSLEEVPVAHGRPTATSVRGAAGPSPLRKCDVTKTESCFPRFFIAVDG